MTKVFKQFLSAALAAATIFPITITASAASVKDFKDVNPSAWYYKAVDYAAAEGLFAGTGSNTFSPDMGMTRGMFVTVMGRKSGVDKAKYTTSRFSDVKPGDWFGPYVEWAAENSIVQAILNDPKLLVLDEPTAGLDPGERIRFRNLISRLAKGRIILLATHIVSDVEYIAKEILLLRRGTLVMQGTPRELEQSIQGKVWEVSVNEADMALMVDTYCVSNQAKEKLFRCLQLCG